MTGNLEPGWYIQQNEISLGPFSREQIGRDLVLGRIGLEVMVSQDQQRWAELGSIPGLIPAVVSEAGTPEGDRALMLARIREDERRYRGETDAAFEERRSEESELFHLHRQIRDIARSRQFSPMIWLIYALLVLVIAIVVLAGLYFYP